MEDRVLQALMPWLVYNGLEAALIAGLTLLALWIWKPWAGAYAGEKGKNLARQEDILRILAEVRAVTTAQKEIESRISTQVWDRQWALNQKRDTYARTITAVTRFGLAVSVFAKYVENPRMNVSGDATEWAKEAKEAGKELEQAVAMGRVFLSPAAIEALEVFSRGFKIPFEQVNYSTATELSDRTQQVLISEARNELAGAPGV